MFTTIKTMSNKELRQFINECHEAREYDAYFDDCVRELNTRLNAQPPAVYLSFSGYGYRVIQHGMPVTNDKRNAGEAIRAARSLGVDLIESTPVWNGDFGGWQ